MYRKCSIWNIPTWVQSELTNKAFLRHVGSKNEVESAHYAHAWALGYCHSASSHRRLRLLQAMPKEKTEKEKTEKIELDRSRGLWTWILEIPELNPTGKSCGGEEWSEQLLCNVHPWLKVRAEASLCAALLRGTTATMLRTRRLGFLWTKRQCGTRRFHTSQEEADLLDATADRVEVEMGVLQKGRT